MPSVYEIVTEKIIKQLESGVAPWQKPWRVEAPKNLVSGKEYRGINVFLLAMQGYGSRYWLSAKQVSDLGGTIKPGEKSSMVTFWNVGEKKIVRNPETGRERETRPFILRYYNVFNVEQTDLAGKLGLGNSNHQADIAAAEKIVAEMPKRPTITQDHRAFYRPSTDTVGMPARSAFDSLEKYYGTIFHELTHSTGHPSRVGREGIEKLDGFGSEAYSKEELIAELGSAMLAGVAGISPAVIDSSAAYLQSWINVLKGDSRMIVSAASAAQKAADFIRGTQTEVEHG